MSLIRNLIENERPDIHGTGRLSTVASNVLLSGNLALENYAVTKNFATVLYTGNGDTQDIVTGISSVDFTVSGNGSGYWLDRDTFEVKTDAGDAVANGSCAVNTSKVHIKSRSQTAYNNIVDGLRGVDSYIFTNATDAEAALSDKVASFNVDGVAINSNSTINGDAETYVLYQTLYTHIKWGTTNQDKKYVEAFNPVTRETMIMYEGTGNAGHEIPHSLGVKLDYLMVKNLSQDLAWEATTSLSDYKDSKGVSSDSAFEANSDYFFSTSDNSSTFGVNQYARTNAADDSYILYGKAKSENWTIVQYVGTGAAGNFVETRDVYGVARKPARAIIKRVDDTGNWVGTDNKRGSDLAFYLNANNAESSDWDIQYVSNGLLLGSTNSYFNASGGQYIVLVEFDTNADGGDGYFNMPTDDSNLNLTDGVFSYTDGKDSNGYIRSTESLAGTTTIDFAGVADGKHWVAKTKDGGYGFYKGLSNGLYNKEYADDNRLVFNPDDGKVYTMTGGELVTNGTFDVDTNGWAAINNANLSIDSGRLAVNATDTDYPLAKQTIKLVEGINKISGVLSGTNPRFDVNTTNGTVQTLVSLTVSGEATFYAPYTGNYAVILKMNGTGDDDTAYFDNISVYKLEATLDQPLTTPLSFLPNPIMVASETPMYIDYNQELPANVMESLEVFKDVKARDVEVKGEFRGKNACTAWVNFDGTDGTIRDSYNVSSVVRNGAGEYDVTFNAAMDSVNYTASVTCSEDGGSYGRGQTDSRHWNTSSARVRILTDSNTLNDDKFVNAIFFGGRN